MKLNDFLIPTCTDSGMPLVQATNFIPNDLQSFSERGDFTSLERYVVIYINLRSIYKNFTVVAVLIYI